MDSTSAQRIKRLIFKLNEALTQHEGKVSQRDLCQLMGITIGTMTKYMRGEVDPRDIRTRITFNLSKVLKITPEALYNYFETGKQTTTITVEQVQSWIRSECGQEDLPSILDSLAFSQKKILAGEVTEKLAVFGQPIKGVKKEGVVIIRKSFEKIFKDECEKRGLSTVEAVKDMTPKIQDIWNPEYWGNLMNILSSGIFDAIDEKVMFETYRDHANQCPMIELLEQWTGTAQQDLKDTCVAAMILN